MIRKSLLPLGALALVAMLMAVPASSQVSFSDAECEAMVGGECLDRETIDHCDIEAYCATTRKREKCAGQPLYNAAPGAERKYSNFENKLCRTACGTYCGAYSVAYFDCAGRRVPIPDIVIVDMEGLE